MKKILGIMAVAAMMLIACDKDPNGGKSPSGSNYKNPTLDAPENNPDNYFTLTTDQVDPQTGIVNPSNEPDKILGVTIPRGGTGVMDFENAKAKSFEFAVDPPTKLNIASGIRIRIKGLGKIKQFVLKFSPTKAAGQKATMEVTVGDQVVMVSCTIVDGSALSAYLQDVCRNWEIEETILKVSGEGINKSLAGGVKFTGCNLSEISGTLVRDYGVKINTLGTEYDVKKIMIDPSGKFGIIFQGKDPYYGDYSLKGTTFSYNFKYVDEDNPIIAGSASGKLTATNGYGRLEVNCDDMKDSSGKKYKVNVVFKMTSEKGLSF